MKIIKLQDNFLQSFDNLILLKDLLNKEEKPIVLILPCFYGIKEKIENLLIKTSNKNLEFYNIFNEIESFYLNLIEKFDNEDLKKIAQERIALLIKELANIINGIYLLGDITPKIKDKVISFGYYLSAIIVNHFLPNSTLIDSKTLIKTNSEFGNARINTVLSIRLIKFRFKIPFEIAIIPGYCGSNDHNEITISSQGGNDIISIVYALALNVKNIEIWCKTNEIMTVNPQIVAHALPIEKISYDEMIEYSYYDPLIININALQLAKKNNIEIIFKNILSTSTISTTITNKNTIENNLNVKLISFIENISLITIEWDNSISYYYIISKIFEILSKQKTRLLLITQFSSLNSFTFAVQSLDENKITSILSSEFEREIEQLNILKIKTEKNLSVISIISDNIKNISGTAYHLFEALTKNGINVRGMGEGNLNMSIFVVINSENLKKALNAIHDEYFNVPPYEISLFLIYSSPTGEKFLELLNENYNELLSKHKIKIKLVGIADSINMLFEPEGIDLSKYKELIKIQSERYDIELFIQKINFLNLPHSVFIDLTDDNYMSDIYIRIVNSSLSIITSNKKALCMPLEKYSILKQKLTEKQKLIFKETTIPTNFPLLLYLRQKNYSIKKIKRFIFISNNPVNFIFKELKNKKSFTEIIEQALNNEIFEYNKSIKDQLLIDELAYQSLIIAREIDFNFDFEHIKINYFFDIDILQYIINSDYKKYFLKTDENKTKLKSINKYTYYGAEISENGIYVGPIELECLQDITKANNIILIFYDYEDKPLIINDFIENDLKKFLLKLLDEIIKISIYDKGYNI